MSRTSRGLFKFMTRYLCDLVCASDLYTRARAFHGTFGENNRQVIARDPTLTHSIPPFSLFLPSPLCSSLSSSLPIPPPLFSHSFQPSDTRPVRRETPQFFRHICFCLATTMHRLYRDDIKICAAMYLLLFLPPPPFVTFAPFSPAVLLLISLFPVCRRVTQWKRALAVRTSPARNAKNILCPKNNFAPFVPRNLSSRFRWTRASSQAVNRKR